MITTQAPTPPIHPALEDAFKALTGAAVDWLVLRIPRGGLSAPQGDIDLLIDPCDRGTVVALLTESGFAQLPRRGADIHLLRYWPDSDQWLWLHFTTSLAFGAQRLDVTGPGGCLARRLFDGVAPRLDPDTEFWLLLWHCLGDKGLVSTHHRSALRIAALSATCRSDVSQAFARATGDLAITIRLLNAIVEENWRAVDREVETCQRTSAGMPRLRLPARAKRFVLDPAGALRRVRESRGLSVALVGPDGAGKTTLAAAICSSVPFQSRVIYMGLTGGVLRRIRRLRLPGLVFIASAFVIWSRYLRGWSHMLRGRLVVFERYVYDAVAPPGYAAGPFERIGRRLSQHLCPGPDLVLILDAPGKVMYQRKGEYDARTLEQWRHDFLSLESRLPRVQRIDAARPAGEVGIDAVASIWREYALRWSAAGRGTRRRRS